MPSTTSPQGPSGPPRFSAAELVPTAFVDQVLDDWIKNITCQMNMDMGSLVVASSWKYQEAVGRLCSCILERLGVEKTTDEWIRFVSPQPVSGWYTCEIVLMWSAMPFLQPGDVLDDCVVTCVADVPLPAQHLFVSQKTAREAFVSRMAVKLSEIADDLPEKEM